MSSSIGVRTHNSEDTIQILENIRNVDMEELSEIGGKSMR